MQGILTEEHLLCIGIGMAGIFAGGMVAKRIVDKLDAAMIRRLIYVMIGISGVVNLIG